MGGGVLDSAIGTIGSFIGGVADFFIAFVFAVYILSGKERLKRQFCRLVRAFVYLAAIGIAYLANFVL